jgi:hypothetical protein
MTEKPSVWGQVRAWVQDEVPATMLEAYRRAGGSVFELVDRVKARREACIADGFDPWTIPSAVRAELLCAWNALVLQTLGDALLDTDYAADPATAGFVPPATAEQALMYYAAVEGWLDRAQQAHASPDYVLDVEVPASLPPWTAERHLPALLRALAAVGEHAAAAMAMLPQTVPDPGRQTQLHAIRETFAAARSKAASAQALRETGPTPDKRARAEWYAREAMELFFHLGQLVADPMLAEGGEAHSPVTAVKPPPKQAALPATPVAPRPQATRASVPGGRDASRLHGIDLWCLTHPAARRELGDSRILSALKRLWARDPDPQRTLDLHNEILDAIDRGAVGYAEDARGSIGHFYRCPWGPVYAAREAVTLGSQTVRKGEQFILDVVAEHRKGVDLFTRDLLVGRFKRTRPHKGKQLGARYLSPRWDA